MRITKLLSILLFLASATGCDSGGDGDGDKSKKADEGDEGDEGDKGEAAEDDERSSSWTMKYSGDLSGEIGGGMVVMTSAGPSSAVRARGKDVRFGFSLNANPRKDPPEYTVLPLSAQLADGTKCKMSNSPQVTVRAKEKKHLDVSISGELKCGDDEKKVTYEATVKKKG